MNRLDAVWWRSQAEAYERAAEGTAFPLDWGSIYPCDDRAGGASFDRQYIHADAWCAQLRSREQDGSLHVDVGSRVDGLCTQLLAAGYSVLHVDIRDPDFDWPHFDFRRDDMTTLATFADASVPYLSCLHAAEHAGLGRYGDEIDPRGMEKAMASLARVLAPSGRLYFAVPVGRQRVVFNAHRVCSPQWVLETFASHGLTLESFAVVDDAGRFHEEALPNDYEGASYSCGCFELLKS